MVDRDDDERDLLAGCVRVSPSTRFTILLPPLTKVRVRVVLASVPRWYSPGTKHYIAESTRLDDLALSVTKGASGTVQVASDIDLRTLWKKGSLESDIGSYRKVWFTGTSGSDGKLRIGFLGPTGAKIGVAAIDVFPFQNAPLVYHRSGNTWLASPTGASIPGLDAFHAHDYSAARSAFLNISNPLTRAYALAFLAGWPDGVDDDFSDELEAIESALASPSLANDARALELSDRLGDFALAEQHYSLRAYSNAYALPPEGLGYFNQSDPNVVLAAPQSEKSAEKHYYLAETLYAHAAGHTFDPIVAWNAGTFGDADFEMSPFALRSLDRIAKIHQGLNATHGYLNGGVPDPNRLALLDLAENIFRGFESYGFLSKEIAGNAELAALAYAARPDVHHHSENGGLFEHWDGASINSASFVASKAWWKDVILAQDSDPNVPPWADYQRRYLHALRGAVDWWIATRLKNGEFGGGEGDDPELAGVLMLPLAAMQHSSDTSTRDGLLSSAYAVLDSEWVANGYYAGTITDVEHTAEFTTYPLVTGLALKPGDPDLLQRCLDVARHVAAPEGTEAAWTILDGQGRRRFQSYLFNANGPGDPLSPDFAPYQCDVPLNGRALVPALSFLGQYGNPTLEQHLFDWLRSWRHDALAPTSGVPLGLVPATIRASDYSIGTNGQWWKAPAGSSSYDFPNNLESLAQLYSGFFHFAYGIDDEGYLWLLPTLRLLQGVLDLEAKIDAGQSPADINTTGTANWALNALRNSSSFWEIAANARPLLATDPTLTTVDDPSIVGTAPYVTSTFLNALETALGKHDIGYPTHLGLSQGPIDVAGGTYGRKGKIGLTIQLTDGTRWLESYFPLATTSVLYSDRAFLFQNNSHRALYGMLTGGSIGAGPPTHIVTWAQASPSDPPLDAAILVNDFGKNDATNAPRLRILAYNFSNTDSPVRMRLWNRLPLGSYVMRTGEALASTDYFKNGVFTAQTIDFDQRGKGFDLTLKARKLQLIELERTGNAAPTANFDLALGMTADPAIVDSPLGVSLSASAYNFSDQTVPGEDVVARVRVLDKNGATVSIGSFGTNPIEFSLDSEFTGISGFDGYTAPTTPIAFTLPLPDPALKLLGAGHRIEITITSLFPDADATNDSVSMTLDAAKLLEIAPDTVIPKAPKKASKLKKLLKQEAKKLGSAWQ